MLERLFLLRVLDRLPRVAANAATFLVTLLGWTVFRAASAEQTGTFLAAMASPARPGLDAAWRTPPMAAAAAAAAAMSFLPRVPGFDRAACLVMASPAGRFAAELAVAVLFAFALAKTLADPFKPFLYFRF